MKCKLFRLLLVNYSSKRCVSCVHLGPSSSKPAPAPASSADGATRSVPNQTSDTKSNYGTETRSRKSLSSKKAQSPPRSQTNTLKSSSGKTSTVHTYQTVECTIDPVQPRRALSPHSSRALSPNSRTLSPASRPSSRVSRATSPPATPSKSPSSRTLSPTPTKLNSRALSPTGSKGGNRPCSPSALLRGARSVLTPAFKMAALASVYRGLVGQLLQPPDMLLGDVPTVNTEARDLLTS